MKDNNIMTSPSSDSNDKAQTINPKNGSFWLPSFSSWKRFWTKCNSPQAPQYSSLDTQRSDERSFSTNHDEEDFEDEGDHREIGARSVETVIEDDGENNNINETKTRPTFEDAIPLFPRQFHHDQHDDDEGGCGNDTFSDDDGRPSSFSTSSPSSKKKKNHHQHRREVSTNPWFSSLCLLTLVGILVAVVFGFLFWKNDVNDNGDGGSCNGNNYINNNRPRLYFRQNKSGVDDDNNSSSQFTFKIMQIADIHLGEAEFKDWGPEQDRKTFKVLDSVIKSKNPDLLVLSGDQLTANNCLTNATAYYKMLGDFLMPYNIPWATIFGNHDDLDYEVPHSNGTKLPAKYSRRQLMLVDQGFSLSLSEMGPTSIFGVSNYVLDIHLPKSDEEHFSAELFHNVTDEVAAQIYFFDSGGGQLKEEIHTSQIQWLLERQLRQQAVSNNNASLPAVAFQHIPVIPDHLQSCHGYQGEGIMPLEEDAGILQTLSQLGNFGFLGVGHNHGNDYCCHYLNTTLQMCYGRHSGYGGYGKWERGSRIYELHLDTSSSNSSNVTEDDGGNNSDDHNVDDDSTPRVTQYIMEWKSWVRLESGEIVDRVDSSTRRR